MKFFHVYNEQFFEGLVKNNLINEDTAFKIQNVFRMPEDQHFNNIAKKGGFLHSMIKENNYPFYIDRLAGGTKYRKWNYDRELINEYAELLGDWFLGFQHHESASNIRRSDWQQILRKMDGRKGPYDLKEMNEKFMSDGKGSFSGMAGGMLLSTFSHGNPEDYANRRYAETDEEFVAECAEVYKGMMRAVYGYAFPVDSYFMFTKLHEELGMRTFMPEVGCQIPMMRIQVALARGIAEGAGKLWGLYYEPWIAHTLNHYSLPRYNDEWETEWFHTKENFVPSVVESGPNSGSSRLLQIRIYYYSLMSGVDYFGEEWGLNTSYTEKVNFTLSPYGIAKKEFIDFARGYKTVKADVPFAIVLPLSYKCVQIPEPFESYKLGEHRADYMDCKISDAKKEYIGHVEDVLKFIYDRVDEGYGNEGRIMTNSRFGDLFDIIYEDASDKVLGKYAALIDATPDSAFATKCGEKHRVIESCDLEKLAFEIEKISDEILPCKVDSLHWILSKDAGGRRFVSIFNNEGNMRTEEHGDTIMHEADARVKVTFRDAAELRALKLGSDDIKIEKADDKTYYVSIPAASYAIFEY